MLNEADLPHSAIQAILRGMPIFDIYRSKKPDHSDTKYMATVRATNHRAALRLAHGRIEAPPGELWCDETDVDDTCRGVKWLADA